MATWADMNERLAASSEALQERTVSCPPIPTFWTDRMRGVIGAITLAAMLHSGLATAQAIRRSAVGFMDVSCERWTGSASNAQGATYAAWVAGFLSGANLAERAEDWLIDEDGTSIRQWMNEYCKQHPTDTLGVAVVVLRQALQERAK